MKTKLLLPLLFLLTIGNLSAQVDLEYWDFESDAPGTDLNALANSGSLGSSWASSTGFDLTDGTGQFVVAGDSGLYTIKLPSGLNESGTTPLTYASPLTTGKYLFEVTFAGWTADAASVGDTLSFKILDSTGANVANIVWQVDTATTTRLRASTTGLSGQYFRNYPYGLVQSVPVTLAIEFDFDRDTVRYLLDGVEQLSESDFSADGIYSLAYSKNGDGTSDWASAATSVNIESMGLIGGLPTSPALHVEEQFRYRNGGGDIGTTAVDATGAPGGFGTYSNYDGIDTLQASSWDFTIHTGTGFNANGNEGFVPAFLEGDNTTWRTTTTADDSLWRATTPGTGPAIYSGTGLDFGVMTTKGGSLKRGSQNLYSSASRTLNSSAQAAVTIPSTTVYIAMVMEVFEKVDTEGPGGTNDNEEAGNFGFALASEDFGVDGATPNLVATPDSAGIGFRAFSPDPLDPIDPTSARLAPTFFSVDGSGNTSQDSSEEVIYFSEGDTMMIIAEIEWGPAVGTEPEATPVITPDEIEGDLDIVTPTAIGYSYQLRDSSDLTTWTNSGVAKEGTGADETWNRAVPAAGEKVFYHVQTDSLTRITLYRVTLAQAASTYSDLSAFDSVSFFGSIDSSILDRITFYDNRVNFFDEIRIGNTPSDVAPGLIVPPAVP